MKLKIPNSIASPQDINDIIIELHDFSKWYGHESIKSNLHAGKKSDPPVMSPSASALLQEWQVKNNLNQSSIDELVNNLKDCLKNSPSITITLAAPPTVNIKSNLVQWCRNNISTDILVNFQFNRVILGGMVVRYGSRIFDWSFRKQILAARNKFPEVLRHV